MLIGYARVSTLDQNLDRQLDALISFGVDHRNVYTDKMSGTKKDRPGLEKMLNELKPEDIIIISDLTRISRSTKDLLSIIDIIKSKKASIKSIKDTWLDTTSNNPYNDFLLTVMSGLSQLERDLISQRTKEGLESAKARGRNGGRPPKRNSKTKIVRLMLEQKYTIADIARQTGLSRSTIYRVKEDINK